MFRKSQFIIGGFVVLAGWRCSTTHAPPAKDFQEWTQIAVTAPIAPKLTAKHDWNVTIKTRPYTLIRASNPREHKTGEQQ
jgi:hypothetical protein